MGMFLERRQLARLVVKRLLAYQNAGVPIDSEQFIQEVMELLDTHLQRQMNILQEIRDILRTRFPLN